MKISYDEFDSKCDKMEALNEAFPSEPYFPTDTEIDAMAGDLDKYYDFIIYLTTNNPLPSNPVETQCMKRLNDIIRLNTEFE